MAAAGRVAWMSHRLLPRSCCGQVQMETISLAAEAGKDAKAKAQLAALEVEAEALMDQQEALTRRWEEEKGRLTRLIALQEEVGDSGGCELDDDEEQAPPPSPP